MCRLFAVGDRHGEGCMLELGPACFPEGKHLTLEDVVVVCGDTSTLFYWEPDNKEKKNIQYLKERPFTTALVDGNHDNIHRFRNLPKVEMFGDEVGLIENNVVYLQRGHVYTINGFKCFVMGGAVSIDKHSRIPNVSWWEDEVPSCTEMDLGLENLRKYDNCVDFIFTHTCPQKVLMEMCEYVNLYPEIYDPLHKYFEFITNNVAFKHWYFGHYHFDHTYRIEGKKYSCLFTNVREVK